MISLLFAHLIGHTPQKFNLIGTAYGVTGTSATFCIIAVKDQQYKSILSLIPKSKLLNLFYHVFMQCISWKRDTHERVVLASEAHLDILYDREENVKGYTQEIEN